MAKVNSKGGHEGFFYYQGTKLIIVLVDYGILPNFLIDAHEDHNIILRSNNISAEWNRLRGGSSIILSMRLVVLPVKLYVAKDDSNTSIQTPLRACVMNTFSFLI